MEVLENGDYRLGDGRVVKKGDIASLHRTAPVDESVTRKASAGQPPLKEGHCSGPMLLLD